MISVVIPAYNEEEAISSCLESLARQECNVPFEVIIVDNASTDKTVEVAKRFGDRLHLRILREKRKGRGRARKFGWEQAEGNIILSTDADTQVPPHWIQTYSDMFRSNPSLIAITGNSTVHDLAMLDNFTVSAVQLIASYIIRIWAGYYCCNGFNFGARKWAYRAVGGFDESLDAQEDMELGKRLQKLGKGAFSLRCSVQMSGRRFRKNMIKGALDYPITYIKKFWFKKKWVPLEDVR